ncbi:MAG: hypothetical protein FWC45_03970 [Treponema sp.]|nr:hypothetical protein [Treponema sp.]
MRKTALIMIIVSLAIFLLFGSCFSLPGGSLNPLSGLQQQASNRASAEVASASGLTGMSQKMMFNVVYAQVFYMGGFGAGLYPLEETQGTVWRLQSKDESGSVSNVDAERALLKRLPNGDEWWYLAWRPTGDSVEYEALMTKDQQAKKIRYFNKDVNRIEEAVFDDPAKSSSSSGNAAPPEPAAGNLTKADMGKYTVGKETITTNAGTYTTDKTQWTYDDKDNKASYTYTWWVDPKAPGGLVKYLWVKSGSKQSTGGELYSVKKGYTTKFSSF